MTDASIPASLPFIRPVYNRIQYGQSLDSFYRKLRDLRSNKQSILSIVHIGDSHIQADYLTAVVRARLQREFGNAGRGLIFPYQLAQSNAPADISSTSRFRWQFNRLAHPEIPISYGISGFGISSSRGSSFRVALTGEDDAFNQVQYFTDKDAEAKWIVVAGNDTLAPEMHPDYKSTATVTTGNRSDITIVANDSNAGVFYGLSVSNGQPGIIYHSIGVNGARYDHYEGADLFWQQLPALQADLYIVSLGTNEAQAAVFDEAAFLEHVRQVIDRLRASEPSADILITTAADSYKKGRPNAILKQVNNALARYCEQNHLPFWDLYQVTNGFGSAYNWSRKKLLSRDRVHFTAEGYRIQGELLYSALARGFNEYTGGR